MPRIAPDWLLIIAGRETEAGADVPCHNLTGRVI
jgi:hypothetical protein